MKQLSTFITLPAICLVFIGLTAGMTAQTIESQKHLVKTAVENIDSRSKSLLSKPVDLKEICNDSYYPGIIRIRADADYGKFLESVSLKAGENEYVRTGITDLDLLNKVHKVQEYRPMLKDLYDVSPASVIYRERHKEWGFHLWYELELDRHSDIIAALAGFVGLPGIKIAEPVYKIRLIEPVDSKLILNNNSGKRWTPNDPFYVQHQWNFNNTGQVIQGQEGTAGWDCNAEAAWDIEKGNPDVIVAVKDNGIEFYHEDLEGNMWPEIGPEGNQTTPAFHGTHVAGTIAAVTNNNIGVAGLAGGSGAEDGASLMSIDVLGGGVLSIEESFIYAADNGAAISQNSWGFQNPGTFPASVKLGIDYFNAHGGGEALLDGGITIFAAGNSNDDSEWYPAYYEGTIAVASHDNKGKKSGFSNYGEWIDITAPGTNIASTSLNDNYSYASGTSMACPHVSGAAALVLSKYYGQLTNEQLREILVISARSDLYEENPGFEGLLGGGALEAFAALELADYFLGVPNPVNFTATTIDTISIKLGWESNKYDHEVMIAWAYYGEEIGQPVNGEIYNTGDVIDGGGTVIYQGKDTVFLHQELTPGTGYKYMIWSLADEGTQDFDEGDYSYGLIAETFTQCVPISELPFEENFNENHHLIYNCWTFTDHIGKNQMWKLGTISNGLEIEEGSYAYINSDLFGPGVSQNASIITPVFDFTSYPEVTLEFKHYFKQWEDVSLATLSYSTDKGDNWHELKVWDSTTPNPSIFRKVVDEVGGEDTVQFKWNFTGEWGFFWCIDDVKFMETVPEHFADFISNHYIIPVGESIIFEDASGDNGFSSWQWDFGEAAEPAADTGPGPHEVIYNSPGYKNPSMTIDGIYTLTKPNFVNIFEITDKLHWDNNQNNNNIGLSSQGIWQSASRFKTSDLVYYNDFIISAINVYISDVPLSAKIIIWERDENNVFHEIINKAFEPNKESWNNISLDKPHRIDPEKELWLGVEYMDPGQGVFPAGIDGSSEHDRKGNLVRTDINDDDAWMPLTLYDIIGNWNLQATVFDGEQNIIINATTEPHNTGIIKGAGVHEINSTVNLDVSPNINYNFINWTENDSVVHDQPKYSFTAGSDRNLVANLKDVTYVDAHGEKNISVYPNPAQDILFISAENPIVQIIIFDITGKKIYENNDKSSEYTIGVNNLNNGLYIIQVYTEEEVHNMKIQINR